MDRFACALITALGGPTKVARAMHAPVSTVNNMRRQLTSSRLNHLRRIAEQEHPALDVDALAARHSVQLVPLRSAEADQSVPHVESGAA